MLVSAVARNTVMSSISIYCTITGVHNCMDKIDPSVLGLECRVAEVEIRGLARTNDVEYLNAKAQKLKVSKNLDSILKEASAFLDELRSWGTFKDVNLDLVESDVSSDSSRVPLKLVLKVSPKSFSISTGVQSSTQGPVVYSNSHIFNYPRVGSSLSASTSRGLNSSTPLTLKFKSLIFQRSHLEADLCVHAHEAIQDYGKTLDEVSLSVVTQYYKNLTTKCSLVFSDVYFSSSTFLPHPAKTLLEPLTECKLACSSKTNTLDHPNLPHSGYSLNVDSYFRLSAFRPGFRARLLKLFPLFDHTSLSIEGNFGFEAHANSVHHRFIQGGPFSPRGFSIQSLGPKIGPLHVGSSSFGDLSACLFTCFRPEYKHSLCGGCFISSSIISSMSALRGPHFNSSVGVFFATSLLGSSRLELTLGVPVVYQDASSVSRGIQLAISFGA
jgi:outer membrane protein assembly factor BamA